MSEQNSPPEPEGNGPNPWVKSLMIWGGIFLALLMVVSFFGGSSSGNGTQLLYSDFRDKVAEGSVANVQISETQIVGEMKNGEQFSTIPVANDTSLPQLLEDNGVRYSGAEADNGNILLYALIQILPFVLILGIAFFALRQVQKGGGAGGAMGFGKSKAKLLTERQGKVTFDDVAGIDEAREELEEIVEFLKDPQRFSKLGGQIPKGALLVGSPGTGKTLLARAIAGEAGVPFFTISGSDFVEMFVGVGASRVRDMFEQAKKNAPCILFIDEIDAVGRSRGHGLGNSNDEREQTLNQLLVEMDGFEANEGIIIIAATNRPDVLDPALLRPGRFDRQVVVPVPDIDGREKILAVHMKKLPLAPDVNPRTIARGTPGFSGADLANLCNEAALLAARRNKRLVAMQEFEDAKDKVMMGAERRSMVMTEDEKKMTAYHEAGHALVSLNEPASDPIHKATIIPRGRALGMVMRLPERDSYSYHRDKMLADLAHKIVSKKEFYEIRDDRARITALYNMIYQRAPEPIELKLGVRHLQQQTRGVTTGAMKHAPTWYNGYGQADRYDEKNKLYSIKFFQFPFTDGKVWKLNPAPSRLPPNRRILTSIVRQPFPFSPTAKLTTHSTFPRQTPNNWNDTVITASAGLSSWHVTL